MSRSPLEIQSTQAQAIQMLSEIQIATNRAVQQTTNSFTSVLQQATALQTLMADNTDSFVTADAAFLATQIAGLATTVDTVAANLRRLLPSGD